MSDIHVLTVDQSRAKLVMHFPVPAADNAVGVSYQVAVLNSGFGGSSILPVGDGPGQITQTELTAIEGGTLLEWATELTIDGVGQTAPTRLDLLRHFYAICKAAVTAQLQAQLEFFGFTIDEE